MDCTLQRIHQIREVILKRQDEDREFATTMKEVEVRALMVAIHSAAGNRAGAERAQKFTMLKRRPEQSGEVPTIRELSKVFPAGSGAFGMFSPEEIAAEAERQRTAVN